MAATRWPDRETVDDQSQGVPQAKLQELVRHWGTDYDLRKEAMAHQPPAGLLGIHANVPAIVPEDIAMLDDLSLLWLTNTGTSSSRSYREVSGRSPFDAVDVSILSA